jgi:hypothetical protein
MESDWKRDKLFCRKVLILKAAALAPMHYCQLDWMKALQHRLVGTIPTIG